MAEEIKRTSKYQKKLQARKTRARRLGLGCQAIPTPILDVAEHGGGANGRVEEHIIG